MESTKQELVIIRGLPGSGKSTYAKTFVDHRHYETDMYLKSFQGDYAWHPELHKMAQRLLKATVDHALSEGHSVVVPGVFPRTVNIEAYRTLAKYHGVELKVYRMQGNYGSIHHVPQFVRDSMFIVFMSYSGERVVLRDGSIA